MIKQLEHQNIEVAQQIRTVFQLSYTIEAGILGVSDFPPLRRPLNSFNQSNNTFLGYWAGEELAGVIEIEVYEEYIDINSLVVKPKFFRIGIANQLLRHLFDSYDVNKYIVETGLNNLPATELYKKNGFIELRQWDTNFGVRKVQFEKSVSAQ